MTNHSSPICEPLTDHLRHGTTDGNSGIFGVPFRSVPDQKEKESLSQVGIPGIDLEPAAKVTAKARKAAAVERQRVRAAVLWSYQEDLRMASIPRARRIIPTDEQLARVAERLEAGASDEDCKHALRVAAFEARTNPASARWFDGITNWRTESFQRHLGQPDPGEQIANVLGDLNDRRARGDLV